MINTEASGFGCKQSHKRAFNRRHAGSRDSGLLLNIWLTSANSSKEKLKAWLRFDIKKRIHPSMIIVIGEEEKKYRCVVTLLHKCWLVQRLGSAIHCNELRTYWHTACWWHRIIIKISSRPSSHHLTGDQSIPTQRNGQGWRLHLLCFTRWSFDQEAE